MNDCGESYWAGNPTDHSLWRLGPGQSAVLRLSGSKGEQAKGKGLIEPPTCGNWRIPLRYHEFLSVKFL